MWYYGFIRPEATNQARIGHATSPLIPVGITEGGQGLPQRFLLEQNCPNPFNPTTEIGMRIAKGGLVSLKVFDVLGREVATLVNEVKQPGVYTVRWDASGVASGVYLYRLTASAFVETRKMCVTK
jgi:hypothetical protein